MRWVIYGAGAVGGVVAGRLAAAGQDVAVLARGAHLRAIRDHGLTLSEPGGDSVHRIPAYADPDEVDWRDGDVVVLSMKSMDTGDAVVRLPQGLPVACLQNGVDNERTALRRFRDVYGICVMLPSSHLAPGVVVANCAPVPGILDLGRYPYGLDATAHELSEGLVAAGFHSRPRPDIMRWKHAKLLLNLGNAVEAARAGRAPGSMTPAEFLAECSAAK